MEKNMLANKVLILNIKLDYFKIIEKHFYIRILYNIHTAVSENFS
jgi:hypothetical protein